MFHMWDWHAGTGLWMAFGGLWMVLFWSSIIALIVWGIKKLAAATTGSARKSDLLDLAKERYARGEISREEYQQMKKDLY